MKTENDGHKQIITTMYYCTGALLLALKPEFYQTFIGKAFATVVFLYMLVDVSKSILITLKYFFKNKNHDTTN